MNIKWNIFFICILFAIMAIGSALGVMLLGYTFILHLG